MGMNLLLSMPMGCFSVVRVYGIWSIIFEGSRSTSPRPDCPNHFANELARLEQLLSVAPNTILTDELRGITVDTASRTNAANFPASTAPSAAAPIPDRKMTKGEWAGGSYPAELGEPGYVARLCIWG
jgi:hypothetical protein